MEQLDIKYITGVLKDTLTNHRFEHTMGVVTTAVDLALFYGVDPSKAELAALLHDCGKCYDPNTILLKCYEAHIQPSEAEKKQPDLLHAKYGTFLAKNKFDVKDQEILDAITYHTTGRPGMTNLEKIIYAADFIEPGRNNHGLEALRNNRYLGLDALILEIMTRTLTYLQNAKRDIDPMTLEAYHYYEKLKQ